MLNKKNIVWAGWLVWLFIVPVSVFAQQVPQLVADINQVPAARGSDPRDIVNINTVIFFKKSTDPLGTELWKSDGTAAGTVLVKDIFSAADLFNFANVNGTLF